MASKKHCQKKTSVEAKTDCQSPKLSLENYYKARSLEDNAKRVLEIDKENMELLKTLYNISQRKGRISEEMNNNENKERRPENTQLDDSGRIAKENIELYKSLQQVISSFSNTPTGVKSKRTKKSTKAPPRCFLEIEIPKTKQKLGEIEIQLYVDDVPKICEKFSALFSNSELNLKGTTFHQIVRGYLCQFGMGIMENNDTSTDDLENQNPKMKHDRPGMVTLCKNGNNLAFNITFKKLEVLDGSHIVFGKVIRGIANLYKIEAVGTKIGTPREKIIISNCGLR